MSADSTLGSTQIADLLAALESLGARPSALAARIGLSIPAPTDTHTRVPSSSMVALFDTAARELRDPLVGLHAGARTVARGPLFFLLLSASRVSEGLRLISRFANVPLSKLSLRVMTRGGNVDLVIDSGDPAIDGSHHVVDYMVGAILSLLRRAIPEFHLLSVDLIHGEIGPAGETARTLGCPVRFQKPHNVLRFPDKTLDTVPAAASPLIARQLETFAESLLTDGKRDHLPERVAEVIRSLLLRGEAYDEGAVANEMRLSVRTLQRQLERESRTFKDIRDAVRLELAQLLLSNRSLKVKTIADHVGFSDTAAFSKAFTRWAGVSPTSYRERKLTANASRRSQKRSP